MDPQEPQIELIALRHSQELARYSLGIGDFTIGRDTSCSIPIPDDACAPEHARLSVSEQGDVLLDPLGNSLTLDGSPVASTESVLPNQTLGIGPVQIILQRRVGSVGGSDVSLATDEPEGLPAELQSPDRYRVAEEIAKGGMGAVLRAREVPTRRTVAMKVMLGHSQEHPARRLRFVEEAQITAQLEHPNIVPVYELGVNAEGQIFYTMKMVKGITLKKILELLKKGVAGTVQKYPLPTLLTIFQKVCDAVAFAHAKGVIHRDLKPANIMIGSYGEVLVMDWGLAKLVRHPDDSAPARGRGAIAPAAQHTGAEVESARADEGEEYATMDGSVVGTPAYMAPEQARGEIERLDARTDIFALGAILYEMLTLERAFSGKNQREILARILEGTPPPAPITFNREKDARTKRPFLIDGQVPESLSAVAMKALAPAAARRYASVKDLQADISAYQNGFATSAEQAGSLKNLQLFLKRHRGISISVGVALVLLVLVTTAYTARVVQERRRALAGEALAQQALNDLRKQAPALRQLADSEAGFQRFDSALEKLDAALSLEPGHLPSYWRRAWIFIGAERWTEALEAMRLAATKDRAANRYPEVLRVVEELAARKEKQPWSGDHATVLSRHLTQVGAIGELTALAAKINLDTRSKEWLIASSLDKWLGKGRYGLVRNGAGEVIITLTNQSVENLEPIKGAPISGLNLARLAVSDLKPLQTLPLRILDISYTKVTDLEPLRGIPIREINLSWTKVNDVTALAGAPLEAFNAGGASRIKNFSVLRGAPLKRCILPENAPINLEMFSKAQLEEFMAPACNLTDLTPLHGMPLRYLSLRGNRVTDLSPLNGAPIVELDIEANPVRDLSPLLELPNLDTLRLSRGHPTLAVLKNHPSLKWIAFPREPVRAAADVWSELEVPAKAAAHVGPGGFPKRSPEATPRHVDLTSYYNGWLDLPLAGAPLESHLAGLPRGLQVLDGVKFDVRGLIQVSGERAVAAGRIYPLRVDAIPVGQQARRLHALHSMAFGERAGVRVASYILHYRDGETRELPIIYGADARDWSLGSDTQPCPNAPEAFRCTNGGTTLRVFHRAYDNPRPDAEIVSLGFVSAGSTASPFVIAITLE